MSPTHLARLGPSAVRAALLVLWLIAAPAIAQVPAERKFVNTRNFSMPFSLTPADRATIASMKLYMRPEQGGEWQLHATASPAETRYDPASRLQVGNFSARVDRDGTYAFAIMTVFSNGRSEPMAVDQLRADQWVTIDSRPPDMVLTPLATKARGDGKIVVGVTWKAQDDMLAPGGVRLEGRWFGSAAWSNFARGGPAEPEGSQEWTIPSNQRMEVRISATDRAGNVASRIAVLGARAGTVTGGGSATTTPDPVAAPAQPNFRLVNNKSVKLIYRVRERPQSGLKQIDLYVTRLGNDWKKHEPPFPAPGPDQDSAEIEFSAPEDGTYGLAMIATSNAGQAPPAPKANDPPQLWIEVDTIKPVAEIKTARLANPNDPRSIVLEWKASDKNIEALPIIFEYAEVDPASGQPGKWSELTTPLPNNGRYVCPSPVLTGRAYQFMIRMNVYDKAGNAAVVTLDRPISLDVVKPQVEITDVKTAPNKTGP